MARRRERGRPINGWLVLDKPEGMTSTGALGVVKRLVNPKKAGHGGTLDPLATGVLPIALGEATKTVAFVMETSKRYRFTVRFGEARATDDREGEVVARSDLRPDDGALRRALEAYVGSISQRPPSFAALKVNGERAYDLARRGEAVDLPPRTVRIDALSLIERPDPDRVVLEILCGKGTYVRSLARDLGQDLGCLGHVESLRRLAVGDFAAEDAVSLETLGRIVDDDALPQILVPVATALADIPALAVTGPQAQRLRAGRAIHVPPAFAEAAGVGEGPVRAMLDGEVVALVRRDDGAFSPLRVFHTPL